MVIISLARQSYRKTAPVFEAKEKQVHEERKNKYMSKLKAFFFQQMHALFVTIIYMYINYQLNLSYLCEPLIGI